MGNMIFDKTTLWDPTSVEEENEVLLVEEENEVLLGYGNLSLTNAF